MQNINNWLQDFKKYWLNKNIDLAMNLFTDNVEYFESPFQKFDSKGEVKEAWEYINKQNISILEFKLFNKEKNKFTVKWSLEYTIKKEKYIFKWIYLMSLNNENRCDYFVQYWERFSN